MAFTTESFLTYSTAFNQEKKQLNFSNGMMISDEFIFSNISVIESVLGKEYLLNIELKKEFSVSICYHLICNFDDRTIKECSDCFSFFDNKYLAPVLKKITTDSGDIILHANKNYAVEFEKLSNKSFSLKFILDAPFLHPSWNMAGGKHSTADEKQTAGTVYTCNFSLLFPKVNETFFPVMPLLYPEGFKAAFILTDHCDFDTAYKLNLFLNGNNNNGWLNKGLKITKGVFTLSSRSKNFDKNDSLEDEEYLNLIMALHKDGSEIAPHALKSKGQVDKATFEKALEKVSVLFEPQTWIDHGSYLKYCYSQGGKTNPDYLLIDSLKKYRYNNLWSFHDINTDAANTLNIFSKKSFSNKIVWRNVSKYFFKGRWMISAHHFRSIIHRNYERNTFTDFLVYSMAQVKGSFIKWKTNKKKFFNEVGSFLKSLGKFRERRVKEVLPYRNEDLLRYSEVIFLEEKRPLAQYKEGNMFMFSTFETTHVKDIYNKEALDKLINEYGLHIGHTYILNDLPYLSGIFSQEKGKLKLSEKWIQFTEALSSKVNQRVIWNPNMGEFIERLKLLLNIEFKWISSANFIIENKNKTIVNGFTFIVPVTFFFSLITFNGKKITPTITDQNFHFFIIDLPANQAADINLIPSPSC